FRDDGADRRKLRGLRRRSVLHVAGARVVIRAAHRRRLAALVAARERDRNDDVENSSHGTSLAIAMWPSPPVVYDCPASRMCPSGSTAIACAMSCAPEKSIVALGAVESGTPAELKRAAMKS